jgi:hypothetical protein
MRQMGRHPGSGDMHTIESAREALLALQVQMENAMQAAQVVELHRSSTISSDERVDHWDDLFEEPVPDSSGSTPVATQQVSLNVSVSPVESLHIEDHLIPLPSNGNVGPDYDELERSHRLCHAAQHLNRIRDLIAEKSFQYSHVIRVSPRKHVNTQSRAAVKRLNLQISLQCRLYTRCRSRLIQLGADPATLAPFQNLTPADVKASTAIVNPNEPGSTRLKLSWIWQTAAGQRQGLALGSTAGAGSRGTASRDAGSNIPAPGDEDANVVECKLFKH